MLSAAVEGSLEGHALLCILGETCGMCRDACRLM